MTQLIVRKRLAQEKRLADHITVTEWKRVPHRGVWDNGIKALMPTPAMADAFWRVFSKKCKYLGGSTGYYESFGAAYEAMLDAWEEPQ